MPQLPDRIETLDIGCGDGRTTIALANRMGITSGIVGIDKVASRLPAELETPTATFATFDAVNLPDKKLAQISTVIDVLPTLSDGPAAAAIMRKAVVVARDFVYIAQPQFDHGSYLLRRGFKTWQSDDSRNRIQGTSLDYFKIARNMLDEGIIADFALMESERIRDSADPAIHSVQSPPDTGPYDDTMHRFKNTGITFSEPVYARFHIILCRKPAQLVPITKRLRAADKIESVIYSSTPL